MAPPCWLSATPVTQDQFSKLAVTETRMESPKVPERSTVSCPDRAFPNPPESPKLPFALESLWRVVKRMEVSCVSLETAKVRLTSVVPNWESEVAPF